MDHLRLFLRALSNRRFVKLKTYALGRMEIPYLGHVISSCGVVLDMDKVKAMLEWEEPKNLLDMFFRTYGLLL